MTTTIQLGGFDVVIRNDDAQNVALSSGHFKAIHTYHAVPLPCFDSDVFLVKIHS